MIHTFHRFRARKLLDPLPLLSVCWVKLKIRNIREVQNTAQNCLGVQNLNNQFLVVRMQCYLWNLNLLLSKWSSNGLFLIQLRSPITAPVPWTIGLACLNWLLRLKLSGVWSHFLTVLVFLPLSSESLHFYHRGIYWLIPQLANHRTVIQPRQQTTWHISALACCNPWDYFGFVPFPKAWGESQTGTPDNSNKRNQGTHITASFLLLPNQSSVSSFCMLYSSS